MTTVESELALAKRFHSLVSNYDSRPALARRNILPTLVRFLRSTDRNLRFTALDSIALLGQHPKNSLILSENDTLLEYVNDILHDTIMDDPEMNSLAATVMQQLSPKTRNILSTSLRSSPSMNEAEEPSSISNSMRRKRGAHVSRTWEEEEPPAVKPQEGAASLTRSVAPSPSSTLGPAMSRDVSGAGLDSAHMVTFDVPQLYPRTSTETLEHVLQTTGGVISYHLHPTQHQMRVYMICKPPILQQAMEQQAGLTSSILLDEIILMGSNARSTSQSRSTITTRLSEGWRESGMFPGLATFPRLSANTIQDARPFTTALTEDPTATRRASYWSLTRLFAVQFCQTVLVYCSPSKSTVEARVAWQREAVAQDLETDNSGGASGRLAERLGKAVSRLW